MPRVSVIIPSYNHEKFIAEAIQSVLDQTYHDFEIVITDDGSTDNTVEEVRRFKDPRIKLFTFERNQGASIAANHCLAHATGEYIAILSSDDIFLPHKLEKQVEFLDEHPEIGAVFGHLLPINEEGEVFTSTTRFNYPYLNQPNKTRYEWLNFFFFKGNGLCHPTALIRKLCYDSTGHYNEKFMQTPDYDMWVRLCLKGYEIHVLQRTLIHFRVRDNQANTSGDKPSVRVRTAWEITQILKHYLGITQREEFLKIFPEANHKFGNDLEADLIPFYLAMIASEIKYAPYQLFAVNTLHDLLQSAEIAQKLKKKYDFKAIDFIKLSGECDALNFHEIINRDQQVTTRDQRLVTMSDELQRKEQMLHELQALIQIKEIEFQQAHQTLQAQLSAQSSAIQQLTIQVAEKDQTIQALHTQFEAQISQLETTLNQIYQTRAWRVVRTYWLAKQKIVEIARIIYRATIPLNLRLAFRDFRQRLIDDAVEESDPHPAVIDEHVEQRIIPPLPEILPKLSIISVLYNKQNEVIYYLESFFRQTYPGDVEIILMDDCSSDNSIKVVEDFVNKAKENRHYSKIPDVRIVKNENNIGNCGARNRGISIATGDILIIIDADCVVNKDFLTEHARAYAYNDVDVAIGPYNIETGDRNPFKVLEFYENHPEKAQHDAVLQDPINVRSFLNCITRNFSIRKDFLDGDLFNEDFSYSIARQSGFGWEDIEMGYRLYKKGARISYLPYTVSIHVSHPPVIDDKVKVLKSLANYHKLFEMHPELLFVARRWALDTYRRICEWADIYNHPLNEDRQYLDNLFQQFLPAPFYIKSDRRKLRILSYHWHPAHQYELYKLPYEFTLVKGLGGSISEFWEYGRRPLPPNATFKNVEAVNIDEYDLAILHFDENILAYYNTNGIIPFEWGAAFRWFYTHTTTIPRVAICHGTPQFYGQYNRDYNRPDLLQVIEEERQRLVDLLQDVLVIVNSYQAQREWQFKKSRVIWHGFDPAEFPPALFNKGILTLPEKNMYYRPHYNGWFWYQNVFKDFPAEYKPINLSVPEPHERYDRQSNDYAYAKYRNYINELRQYSIYFNPTLRSPMPRSRGEAMMCGLVTVSVKNHDVEMFIKNGVNGFYSDDPDELRDYLLFLLKHPEKARQIGLAGRQVAIDLFNHDRYLYAWEETLSAVLADKNLVTTHKNSKVFSKIVKIVQTPGNKANRTVIPDGK